MLECKWAGICAGCPWIEDTYSYQLNQKMRLLRLLWAEAGLDKNELSGLEMVSLGEGGLRDRADMTLFEQEGRVNLGLYDLNQHRILDIERCPQMSSALTEWFCVFRKHLPKIKLGAVRLRVSPKGAWGLWCDFPNQVIAEILADGDWLRQIVPLAQVEMSQRRNQVVPEGPGFRLGEASSGPWFETYLGEAEKAHPLYTTIGGFTQPGFVANQALVRIVMRLARQVDASSWLELGAGIGNFTLPLAAEGARVTAVQNDKRASSGLKRALHENELGNIISIETVNMHQCSDRFQSLVQNCEAVLADPPRSGLRRFLDLLAELEQKPRYFLYVSCSATSLAEDLARLRGIGYRLHSICGLDQFPQSKHCEWITLLEL